MKKYVFLRAENYMDWCPYTARELVFYDHDGQEVQVVQAFAVAQEAMPLFRKLNPDLRLEEVTLKEGSRVYAMDWRSTNAFVVDHDPNYGWREYNFPPAMGRFRPSRHVCRLTEEPVPSLRSMFGDCEPEYQDTVSQEEQVIIAPRPVAFVRGRRVKGWARNLRRRRRKGL